MSLNYNQTTTPYNGIIQQIEREIGANLTDISSNATELAQWTTEVNLALDAFTAIAIQASGTWQWDDSNASSYPILKGNLVASRRDYSFTTDSAGNLILDIYRVFILPSATATEYVEVKPIDEQSGTENDLTAESSVTGVPSSYDKTGNGIRFNIPSSYSVSNGIKIYVNREASYFTTAHTDRKAGIPGIFHEYLVIKPALKYAGRKGLPNYNDLFRRVEKMESDIKEYFALREKDVRHIISPKKISYI